MKSTVDITVIIVNFNTKELLAACLESLFNQKNIHLEIIVVDNNSTDGSIEYARGLSKKVTLIENSSNIGFAAANNKGIAIAQGRYILLLNSDTEVHPETLAIMKTFMDENTTIGASTCFVKLPDGTIDPASHRGFPTPWAALTYFTGLERLFPSSRFFARYHQWYKDMKSPHEIDCPSGAFFLVRKSVADKVGVLDEQFFMYAEDIDWAYRIKQKGYPIFFFPGVSILHKKKQSGRASSEVSVRKQTEKYFYITMEQFYRKHYMKTYAPLVTFSVLALLKLRVLILNTIGI